MAGLVLAALFVLTEQRTRSPLLDFALFANRAITTGNLAMLLVGGVTVGLFFILSLQMQNVFGYDAMTAGIGQLPLALALIVTAGMLPPIIAHFGSSKVLAASLVALALGLIWIGFAPANANFLAHLLGPSIVIGIGLGGAFIGGTELAVQASMKATAALPAAWSIRASRLAALSVWPFCSP